MILGAGLAGLSLAEALLDRGVRRPIMLVDRRTRWTSDRTWCTWQTGAPQRYLDLSAHRWHRWSLWHDDEQAIQRSSAHPYVHLDAGRVYDHALARLRSAGAQVEIRGGERVTGVDARDSGDGLIEVRTSGGRTRAGLVVDALGAMSPLRGPVEDPLAATQRFLGWEVEADRPVFDPATATLMDFRAAGPGRVDFLYTLPFTPTRALLEHTTIGRDRGPDDPARREALRRECARIAAAGGAKGAGGAGGPGEAGGAGDLTSRVTQGSMGAQRGCGVPGWRLLREERGSIPMTPARFPLDHGPGTLTVGGAAGAVRPSSGYAFTRIQRHVERVAAVIAAGGRTPPAVGPRRFALLDRLFLAALHEAPDGGRDLFWRLGRGVDGDAFARFMTDASSPADELRIAAALPPLRMLVASRRGFGAGTAAAVRDRLTGGR